MNNKCTYYKNYTSILDKLGNTIFNLISLRAERRAYYANCLKAEQEPKRYLSLILDGMDQSKTNLPHANCLSKVSSRKNLYLLFVFCYSRLFKVDRKTKPLLDQWVFHYLHNVTEESYYRFKMEIVN